MSRQRRSSQAWHNLIEQQRTSGESVSVFCIEHGLCSTAFYSWRKRFRSQEANPAQFVRLEQPPSNQSSGSWISLTTPQGFRLECNGSIDPQRIAEMLTVLDRRAGGC